MDGDSSRRAAGGLVISRRSSSLVMRNSTESPRDQSVQVCSRAGCSSKLNLTKTSQIGSPSKIKMLKTPFRPAGHAKEVIGSSSKTPAVVNTSRKPIMSVPKKKSLSRIEPDSQSNHALEENEPIAPKSTELGSSSSTPTNKPVKRNTRRFGLEREESSARGSTSKYNMRNLRCNSISDIVPSSSGCSSSSTESNVSKRKDIGRKRVGESEGSLSVRGKKINGSVMDDKRSDSSSPRGTSISDSRRSRNIVPTVDNDTASIRTRRVTSRTRLGNQENRSRLTMVESPLMTRSSPQSEISMDSTGFSSESHASSFSRSRGSFEVGISQSFMNRGGLRQYNLDGIAEMLLALERIEQEEEPTYEQLLVLETNLFLGGLTFHDQHRDMRLDIDNMSYEELLALEERMGNVITAVPEEDLGKCLDKTIYLGITGYGENEDDVKCSICQEEYADGEEVGRLKCDHRYHEECIHQWLRLKNWCPICKTSALPSSSPS